MTDDGASGALRALRDALRSGIPDADDFVFQLSRVLDELGLAATSAGSPPPDASRAVQRYLPAVQQALVSVLPTFLPALDDRGRKVVQSFFCPPRTAGTAALANAVALTAYVSLSAMLAPTPPAPLPREARDYVLSTLSSLAETYSTDSVYWAVWGTEGRARELQWDDAVRALCGLPAKTANAVGRWRAEPGGWTGDVPPALVPRAYFDHLVRRLEALAYELAQSSTDAAPLRVLVEKLGSLGLLSTPPDPSPSPSFLPPFLPSALAHLHPPPGGLPPYPDTFFPALFLPMPTSALAALADALLAHLPFRLITSPPLEPDVPDPRVRRASIVLSQLLGAPDVGADAWNAVIQALMVGKLRTSGSDTVHHARRRMVVAWVAGGGAKAAQALINAVFEAWADPKGIKYGVFSQQLNLTHVLLLALSLLPPLDPFLVALSRRGRFIQAIQAYLSHPDTKLRRLGMLVAEVLSELTIEEGDGAEPTPDEQMEDLKAGLDVDEETGEPARKPPKPPKGPRRLQFKGMWEGTGDGRDECRWLRRCVGVRDADAPLDDGDSKAWLLGWDTESAPVPEPTEPTAQREPPKPSKPARAKPKAKPKIVMLDDEQEADPLEGYADSSPSSSRSPSPTPSFLNEVAADPSLAIDATKKHKLKRPVYVRQLAELLRDKDKPESIEMGLQWGEGLVRAKRGFGTEVADNAIAVTAAALALSNPFNLDNFDVQRQGLVTALVACAPRIVPPYLAEQYFSSTYSLIQKSVMLTALAMGARELAGLPVPDPPRTNRRIDFPTKTLPPALHAKYMSPADVPAGSAPSYTGQLEDAVTGMRNLLLSKGAKQGEESVPQLARERRLRVSSPKRQRVAEDGTRAASTIGRGDMTPHEHGGDDGAPPPIVQYSTVAAEYFVLPLINRFWDYYQDASVRETRAVAAGGRFRGAGTGLVLSPMSLQSFLATLALLVHAARHAPTFLAVLAPASLELAVTIGARHPARPDDAFAEKSKEGEKEEEPAPEAQVVGSALELALASLDTAVDLDKGRTFALDAPQLVLAAGEWATAVFDAYNGKGGAPAGAGSRGSRLRAAAAGVVVKVAEIGEKWGPGVGR